MDALELLRTDSFPPRPAPPRPRVLAAGDGALVVEFGNTIDPAINAAVIALDAAIARANIAGVIETAPTYRSLLVQYDPEVISPAALLAEIRDLLLARPGRKPRPGRRWTVPVCYGGEFGEDLEEVARELRLSPETVIEQHLAAEYAVYMIGFAPGFAYLGGLSPALHLPRRATPRARIPGGSVIIGGMQTAVAPLPTPSGWHILGRSPVRPFDLRRPQPVLFRAGDCIRFRPIGRAEFDDLSARAEAGEIAAELRA